MITLALLLLAGLVSTFLGYEVRRVLVSLYAKRQVAHVFEVLVSDEDQWPDYPQWDRRDI